MCDDCSELCSLYHNLHHQKQKLYVMCSEIVEKRKTSCPGIDTTQILNQLLADDSWLETVIMPFKLLSRIQLQCFYDKIHEEHFLIFFSCLKRYIKLGQTYKYSPLKV